ncbi:uncharacterized protein LOC113359496 [Papaver somniferum]|uniref:uncharacterized protein LOC113359496 n=1 Tax=Papaver somniferum TaxID=3469 RepID=UPI000E70310B|nr:uncharacterized protein LOC113359496 [Papaver somniferum]
MVELWFARNRACFDEEVPNLVQFKLRMMQFPKENSVRMKGTINGSMYDMSIMTLFGIKGLKAKTAMVKECSFQFPEPNQVLICCDGASKGNPGKSGYGFVGRSNTGSYLGAEAGGLGIATNYIAEVMALIYAGEWAVRRQFLNVCFSLDSKAVLQAFSSGNVPWIVKNRWERIQKKLQSISFRHSFREVNFSADKMAKKGASLRRGKVIVYEEKPAILGELECENQAYFRFF